MPREKELYREVLVDILNYFDDRKLLSLMDVARYTGRDKRTVKKLYRIDAARGITVFELARLMSYPHVQG